MPIGTIESINPLNYKLVYGRADGMPNSLESMVLKSPTTFSFGYTAAELADGVVVTPDKTSPSLTVGTWEETTRAVAADMGQGTAEGLHRSKI
ncbi:hypothetical protein VE00_06741 [Pseudogymnoascus sp. WSF 3629]|nr:hypothetical protein VE00_06741 [Pseudogymnoascus sp. WSF 3629]